MQITGCCYATSRSSAVQKKKKRKSIRMNERLLNRILSIHSNGVFRERDKLSSWVTLIKNEEVNTLSVLGLTEDYKEFLRERIDKTLVKFSKSVLGHQSSRNITFGSLYKLPNAKNVLWLICLGELLSAYIFIPRTYVEQDGTVFRMEWYWRDFV